MKIIIHKKTCQIDETCFVKKVSSSLEEEIKLAILRKATILETENEKKRVKKYRKKNPPKLMDSQKTTR